MEAEQAKVPERPPAAASMNIPRGSLSSQVSSDFEIHPITDSVMGSYGSLLVLLGLMAPDDEDSSGCMFYVRRLWKTFVLGLGMAAALHGRYEVFYTMDLNFEATDSYRNFYRIVPYVTCPIVPVIFGFFIVHILRRGKIAQKVRPQAVCSTCNKFVLAEEKDTGCLSLEVEYAEINQCKTCSTRLTPASSVSRLSQPGFVHAGVFFDAVSLANSLAPATLQKHLSWLFNAIVALIVIAPIFFSAIVNSALIATQTNGGNTNAQVALQYILYWLAILCLAPVVVPMLSVMTVPILFLATALRAAGREAALRVEYFLTHPQLLLEEGNRRLYSLDFIVRQRYILQGVVDRVCKTLSVVLVPIIVFGSLALFGSIYGALSKGRVSESSFVILAITLFVGLALILVMLATLAEADTWKSSLVRLRNGFPCVSERDWNLEYFQLQVNFDSMILHCTNSPIGFRVLGLLISWNVVQALCYGAFTVVSFLIQARVS